MTKVICYLAAAGRGTRCALPPLQPYPCHTWLLPAAVTSAEPRQPPRLRCCPKALKADALLWSSDWAGTSEGENCSIVSAPLTPTTGWSCRGLAACQMEQFFNFAIKTEIKVGSTENVKDWRTSINFEYDNQPLAP